MTEINYDDLPKEIAEYTRKLDQLWIAYQAEGSSLEDEIAYLDELSMFLSDLKTAQLYGKISMETFELLKSKYFRR